MTSSRLWRQTVCAAVFLVWLFVPRASSATPIVDPAGDFMPTFGGLHNGDLDVLAADVKFDFTNFYFHALLNGPIGQTTGGIYVLGFNRGAGTAGFGASLGLNGVLFDRVIVINNNDTSTTAGVTVTHSGRDIFAVIPAALPAMASTGFAPQDYTWNLWPRDPLSAAGVAAISDFAPDNSNAAVDVVPEPATLTLLLSGLAVGYRKRKRA